MADDDLSFREIPFDVGTGRQAYRLVSPDARNRVALGGLVVPGKVYKVTVDDQNRITLEPAVVMTAQEYRELGGFADG